MSNSNNNNQTREKLNHSRGLGLLERYQVSKQLANVYGTLLLSAHIQLDYPLPFNNNNNNNNNDNDNVDRYLYNKLSRAIQLLCNEQPLLSVTIADIETTTPRFNPIDSIDYNDLVTVDHGIAFFDDTVLTSVLEKEIGTDFDLTSKTVPLWRLHILTHQDRSTELFVILTVHHVISDGLSTTIILSRLLELLNQPETKTETESNDNDENGQDGATNNNNNIIIDNSTKLNESLDKRTPHHPTAMDLLPIIIKHKLLPSFITRYFEVPFWAGQTPAVKQTHNTLVRVFEIPADKFTKLLNKCKLEKTTPHAAIYISTILANLIALSQDTMSLRTCTPINARSLCVPEAPQSEVGNFVGSFDRSKSYSATILRESNQFWEACREYKTDLAASSIGAIKSTNMLHYVGDFPSKWIEFWTSKLTSTPMGRSCSFEVSDVGRWGQQQQQQQTSQPQQWKLISSTYAQSANVYGSTFNINLVSVCGSSRATCTWQKGSVDENTIQTIIDNILQSLDNCIHSN
ncbi:hypothetical protein DFA_04004 [Cavenderia fasciculata]|uniref:Condensation domain-containing protein n=1 Tax=Cavenderia fasciculata TaxID=261658 RepID=F4Q109_CACFS|nr:uncharacterized protein DFA_04004 [Cavenderia fasciculata]EGG18510.1 hypothetical protein DFA_04004 [Cavenderia fasciculata]|eukprot:XP_004366414.1 hypothetical protein DFA_04004 [Cavenderia fasciculata]